MREKQIVSALADGPQTIAALVDKLYPDLEPALRRAAAQQLMAHLQHLQARGETVPEAGRWSLTAGDRGRSF
jgi:hypothetical protein